MAEINIAPVQTVPIRIVRTKDISHTNTDWHGREVILNEEKGIFSGESYIRIWQNEQNEDYPSHWHNAFEIILPVENYYDVKVEQEDYHLNPGEILIIPAGKTHSIAAPDSGRRYILLFGDGSISKIRGYNSILSLITGSMLITPVTAPEIYNDVYTRITMMITDFFNLSDFYEFTIFSNLLYIMATVAKYTLATNRVKDTGSNITHKKHFQRFQNVLDYIDSHFTDNLTLEEVAEYSGFSKYYFSRLFKDYSGYNFYDYLVMRRIKEAELLLTQPMVSITEAALQSGFLSISTFNRSFKKIKGCTPGEYKALYSHGEPSN